MMVSRTERRPQAARTAEAEEGRLPSIADREEGERRGAAEALERSLGLPTVAWHGVLPTTMDEAHRLAEQGAAEGTIVLADAQSRGRGRGGKRWVSEAGAGLWLTLIERPIESSGLDVLSLRVGLRAARALEPFSGEAIRIKWPNDLMLPAGKLGGILVEVRWREQRPEWVAIGIGINLRATAARVEASSSAAPAALTPAGRVGPDRLAVLGALIPALRAAAGAAGALSEQELQEFAARDWARGRAVVAPQRGIVVGISSAGALLIETPQGTVACTSGSLVLDGASA